jgi:hypothetical protein
MPPCDGSEPLFALPKLRGPNAKVFATSVQTYKAIQNYFDDLSQYLSPAVLANPADTASLLEASAWFGSLASPDAKIIGIREALQIARSIEEGCKNLKEPVEQTNTALGLAGTNCLSLSLDGIDKLTRICELVAMLQPDYLGHRAECFDQDELDLIVPRLAATHKLLVSGRDDLQVVFDLESIPDIARLKEMEVEFRQASFFSFLSSDWRSSSKDLKAIRASKRVRKSRLKERLENLVEYAEAKDAFEHDKEFCQFLPGHFDGLQTEVQRITALRAWYKAIRNEYGVGFSSTAAIGDSIIGTTDSVARALRSLHKKGLRQESDRIAKGMHSLLDMFPGFPGLGDASVILDAPSSDLPKLVSSLPEQFTALESAFVDEQIAVGEMTQVVTRLTKLIGYLKKWQELDVCSRIFDGRVDMRVGLGATDDAVVEGVERVSAIASIISSDTFPIDMMTPLSKELSVYPRLRRLSQAIRFQ